MSPRSRRLTRFLVTAEPTARLTTNPTLAGSESWIPSVFSSGFSSGFSTGFSSGRTSR